MHIHVPPLEVVNTGAADGMAAMQEFARQVASLFSQAIADNKRTLDMMRDYMEASEKRMLAALDSRAAPASVTPIKAAKRTYDVSFNRDDEGIDGMRVVARDS